jgi:AraC-like DNA-binding protein
MLQPQSATASSVSRAGPRILAGDASNPSVNEYAQAVACIHLTAARLASAEARQALTEAAATLRFFTGVQGVFQPPCPAGLVEIVKPPARHGLDDVRLSRVLDYMQAHLGDPLGIEELAGIACLSPFHFTRMFRNSMGMPPYRYVAELRLERAKSLLVNGGESLVEIALATCFSSQSNFTRAFRQATGMTPGAYRRGSGGRARRTAPADEVRRRGTRGGKT